MHGCNSGSALLVNAEVDSMGGVVDGGGGIGLKTSPRRAAIEKAQKELRLEYDVREERRRELEFLEKGGNPLDFKLGNAASVSVQSTSLTDQHQEQFVTSEAKGSFVLTASPHGDSVDSSARPGAPSLSEPNTADNLLLFDGETELPEGEKRSLHSNKRNNIAPSEQSSRIGGSQNAKETEDSAIFRPYARRNRSKSNHGPRGASRDGKGIISDTNKQKDHNVPSVSKPKPTSLNGEMLSKDPTSNNNPLDNELVVVEARQTASGSASVPKDKLDVTTNRNFKEDLRIMPSQDDAIQTPVVLVSGEAKSVGETDLGASGDLEPPPCAATTQPGNESCSGQPNGFGNIKVDRRGVPIGDQNCSAALGMKNFDSESSCPQTSLARDVNNNNNDNNMCSNAKNIDENGNTMEQTSEFEKLNLTSCGVIKERSKTNTGATTNNEHHAGYESHPGGGNTVKSEEDIHIDSSCMQNKAEDSSNVKGLHHSESSISNADREGSVVLMDHPNRIKEDRCERLKDVSISTTQTALVEKVTTTTSNCQPSSTHSLKLADKAHEDSILEEAKIIEVKRKRIAELSVRTLPSQIRRKSHWGFVLEEMAWLANDFAQERLWKISAAAQLSHQASCTSRLRFEKQNKHLGVKTLSHNMAKAVMQFWHSIELLLDNDVPDHKCIGGSVESGNIDSNVATGDKRSNSEMELETIKYLDGQNQTKHVSYKVHAYALRFLKDNRSRGISSQAEAPTTPDKICDSGIADMSWDDRLTEESLFYTVPPTAMEAYRKSIESHFLQFEKTGSSIQEEVETSMYDAAAEFGHEEIAYDEDEGETSTYYLHGVYEGSRSSKSLQKKHKNKIKSCTHKSSEIGIDLPYGHYSTAAQPSVLFGKRPASLNVGTIPTKRVRTASRQRVVSPFAGVSGTVHAQAKTDASSGDTNSFQDDQSTLHGSQIHKSVEVESIGDFEKQLPYDCGETSVKTKKKKPKNLGPAYDQGWQLDSVVLNEQRDHSKKRLDSHHFEPNGSSGLYGHSAKKLKTTKQSLDTFDNVAPMTNSIPSPAASQMSNMSNPSKFIRIISSGRDRGRKAKALKVSAGQPGSGSPWSLFEDQALVVLVHDMGPNWELVSDAINSTIQFKCIFRKPKECKERHKILMDRSAGDGADSAEDSGSSQSYPSTLPGIPKGSARQLFQRLQGPMEEDTLKSHFDKIIKIGQKQRYHRNQNDNQDMKQLVPVHSSHVNALNQVCPNNLNGGFLTPLDLCDTNQASPDVLPLGYQVSHTAGLPLSNHSSASSVLPSAGLNSPSPTSSGISLSNNLSSSGPLAASVRDSRYGVSRTPPLSVDEQQRIQQYNQMISSRNIQQSTMSVPGSLSGSDRGGVRMLPGGNAMGMMGGINRSITMSRPGFQGMPSSSMLSSGGMLSSSMVGMPSPVNMHSGVGAGQGNSMLRPRETVHMMRPGHNQEHQRQMMVPELPMQVTQGNSQGIPAFSGMSSAFNNQTTPPSVQSYPGHSQQPHQLSQQQSHLSNPHPLQGPNHAAANSQQAYAIRFAKERHLQHQQQRYLQHQQQQQQLAASNALIPHAQSQSQLPISSPLQNSSQAQPQNSSQQVSLSPVTSTSPLTPMSSQHQQQKHHLQHGFSRNPSASAMTNQATKQRQRQPQQRQFPQPGRQHPNQPQHAQSQQQTKVLKGLGRGNMLIHQNNSVDPSHLNGLSVPPGSQTVEKGDQIMPPMMQSQNIHPGSGNPNQSPKPLVSARSSNHSQLQQKLHSGPTNTSLKQLQSVASPSDNRIQGHVLSVTSGHIASTPQPAVASNHHQLPLQSQPQCKQSNQAQPSVQRMLQPNCQVHSESSSMSQSDSTNIDQHPANSASQVGSNTVTSPGCMDAASVTVVPPTVSSQWQTSESPFDSNVSNPVTQASFLGSTPVGNSAGNEPSTISQGMGPQQLSTSLPSHAHNSGGQWQQQQPPLKQTSSQPILSQKSYEPPEEHKQQQQEQEQLSPKGLALQRQAQQQVQHMQPGQSSLLICPPNSKVE